jgi:hypothetical protein
MMAKLAPRFVCYGLVLLVLAAGACLVRERIQLTRPLPAGTKVVIRTIYTLSKKEVYGSASLPSQKGFSTLDLLRLYPADQGWRPSFAAGEVILTRTVDGLSPDDMQKTHLGAKGGFVAVIRGPAGVDGGIIRVTTLRLSDLPADYQRQARQGTLDLPDEVALMQILDSLNESGQEQ